MVPPRLGLAPLVMVTLVVLLAGCRAPQAVEPPRCCTAGIGPTTPSAATLRAVQQRTHVVLLGTGTPNAEPTQSGPALAVVVRGRPYLVDAGPGVVRRAEEAFQRGVVALKTTRLDTVFLTHLHSDHTLGLADLLLSPWVLGRRAPLHVIGPPGTAAMVRHLQAAYAEDIRLRLQGLEPANATGHRARVQESQPGVVLQIADLTVRTFRAHHGAWKHAWGIRFVTPDLDVCISGDTAPYPEMTTHYAGCDLLIHEVYSVAAWRRRPAVWRRYHAAGHTSTTALGRVAARVKPGLLVLHHLLWKQVPPAAFVQEIRAHYAGPVVYGRDLMLIGLSGDFARATASGSGPPATPRRGTFRVLRLKH